MIPDEAVEAAAEAINVFAAKYVGVLDPVPLNDMSWLDREHALDEARAALEAAAPPLQAAAWDEAIAAEKTRQDAIEHAIYAGQTIPDEPLLNPYRSQA